VIHPHCDFTPRIKPTYTLSNTRDILLSLKKQLHVLAKVNSHFQAVCKNIKVNLQTAIYLLEIAS